MLQQNLTDKDMNNCQFIDWFGTMVVVIEHYDGAVVKH
jgi:hypothetical protein